MDVSALLNRLASGMPRSADPSMNRRACGVTQLYQVQGSWSLNLYSLLGRLLLPDSGEELALRPGTVCLMPPGIRRRFVTERPGTQWVVHFQPASPLAASGVTLLDGAARRRDLAFLADALLTCGTAERRRAVLWHLLCLLEEMVREGAGSWTGHRALDAALAFIRRHLAEPIAVADVVAAAGCSHNHLTRLFRRHRGTTVIAALRSERMQRARILLRQTDLAIGAVGAEVGIPDPHLFNKTVRRHFGMAPSAVRRRRGS